MLYKTWNGFILQALLPDTSPSYPVTDCSYLFLSIGHHDGASLAGDPIKGSQPAWGETGGTRRGVNHAMVTNHQNREGII